MSTELRWSETDDHGRYNARGDLPLLLSAQAIEQRSDSINGQLQIFGLLG
jgi:hypothetical protein